MNETIVQLHLAAQYLAAIGLNYLNKAPDDSQSNLRWDAENARIESRKFGLNEISLALNIHDFALIVLSKDEEIDKLLLTKTPHRDVLSWLNRVLNQIELTPKMVYAFHYELPYEKVNDEFVFSAVSRSQTLFFETMLTQAQNAFQKTLERHELNSEIRIWPHHFDLGFYTQLAPGLFLGGGLAMPDTVSDEMYFYASGWLEGTSVKVENFDPLSKGEWRSEGFVGGVLPASNTKEEDAVAFYSEAIQAFTNS